MQHPYKQIYNEFYFLILNPNIIATQPLAGVSAGLLNELTLTTILSC
jgi:hypothetical protein